MELILREIKKKRVAVMYKQQYFMKGVWIYSEEVNRSQQFDQLIALGTNPDADKIDSIIGNKSWTHALCSECGEYCADAIMTGTTVLCEDCLKLFLRALEKKETK